MKPKWKTEETGWFVEVPRKPRPVLWRREQIFNELVNAMRGKKENQYA